jgi:hypothetical protein
MVLLGDGAFETAVRTSSRAAPATGKLNEQLTFSPVIRAERTAVNEFRFATEPSATFAFFLCALCVKAVACSSPAPLQDQQQLRSFFI